MQTATPGVDAFAYDEVRLLISLLAHEVMHIVRRAMAAGTGTACANACCAPPPG